MIAMKRRSLLKLTLGLSALSLVGLPPQAAEAAPPKPSDPGFARYVTSRLDDQFRGNQSHAIMYMKVKTKRYKRTLKMESWSLGKHYSLVRIRSPRKEKGTATLKAKGQMFTYLSKTDRTIKITSGLMGGSWMGSHFTNDDLMQSTRLDRDFTIKLSFTGKEDGTKIYRFTLTPKPDAPVVWGKIVISVRQSDLQPTQQIYFDEDGAKVRKMTFAKYKKRGKRVIPTVITMKPLDGSGEYTRIIYRKLDFNVKLKKSFFTLQRLKSMR